FFDDIQDLINVAKFLQGRLPPDMQEKIKWFNSDMATIFKETEYEHLLDSSTWGLCTIDSFGMEMDIPDILLAIQWRVHHKAKLPMVWQRFGRKVRDKALLGTALLFAEKEYLDNERKKKDEHRNKKETK
ncbi:hypothetical protein SERLA73DRAFT_57054, partial [Serpula lacrymans var. lacrymans S7.3]